MKLLKDGTLLYSTEGGPNEPVKLTISPPQEAWDQFLNTCLEIRMSQWETSYHDENVLDSTGWEIKIKTKEFAYTGSGYHLSPPNFDDFCVAAKRLVGGLDFNGLINDDTEI